MTTLGIGLSLPFNESRGIARAAIHAEQLGFDAVSTADVIVGDGSPAYEAVVTAATAAAVTERIRIAFGVLSLPTRGTALLAAQIQTLQHLSGNRVELGVGIGGFPGSPYWTAADAPVRGRGRHTDAALAVLGDLVAGKTVDLEGTALALAPAAQSPPVLIGGTSDAALRRTVRHGDGWAPSQLTSSALAARLADLRDLAAAAGRGALTVDYGTHALVADGVSRKDALVRDLAAMLDVPEETAAQLPIYGGPAQVAERLAEYAAAGADRVTLALDGPDWFRQAEVIAEAARLL